MNKRKEILNTFAYVTTGVVLATTIFIKIFWPNAKLSVDIFFEIISISFFCSLGNLFYYCGKGYSKEKLSKNQLLVRTILHYLYINSIVIGGGLTFKWFYWYRIDMMIAMVFGIMLVFAVIWVVNVQRDRRLALQLNEKLREYYEKE
jgi:hypothetical protein